VHETRYADVHQPSVRRPSPRRPGHRRGRAWSAHRAVVRGQRQSSSQIFNRSADRAEAAKQFVEENVENAPQRLGLSPPRAGQVGLIRPMTAADPDAILATNSSSYPNPSWAPSPAIVVGQQTTDGEGAVGGQGER
jgi:hypothetical protein